MGAGYSDEVAESHGAGGAHRPVPGGSGRASRPSSVELAFWAGLFSVLVGFAIFAFSVLSVSDAELRAMVEQMRTADGQRFTLEQIRALRQVTVLMAVLALVLVAGVWIALLHFMRRGRNWARVAVTVLGAVWILLAAQSVFSSSALSGETLLAVVQVLSVGATLLLVHLHSSNEYFQLSRRR